MDFVGFQKIPRLSRGIIITEKIDGTNAQVCIGEDGEFCVGSRSRWITPQDDNYGFARWAMEHIEELHKLGVGRHFGEWWGSGIQRNYGLSKGEKRFSLFNVHKWADATIRPNCCYVVPTLYTGPFDTDIVWSVLKQLEFSGSSAMPGYMNPEGIVIYHTASNYLFKKTIEHDDVSKGAV